MYSLLSYSTCSYFSLHLVEILSLSYPGSCQHLLLATMFALNFCYQPVDLVLVIKCGILEILSMLTNNSCSLMNQGWFAASTSGSMLLSGAVRLACARLLQILTVAARWEWRDCKQLQWRVHDLINWKLNIHFSVYICTTNCPVLSAPVRICCPWMYPML